MKRKLSLLMVLMLITPLVLTPPPVEALNYGPQQDLGNVDASFWGEGMDHVSGRKVKNAGDVNGDGYGDFLIYSLGIKTHLILGKASGWKMDTDLSEADASFHNEFNNDYAGYSIDGGGDVNGDGYDDFIIGAFGNDENGDESGQTYLIFGKPSGWSMNTDLSDADASFLGENPDDCSGRAVGLPGDVNGDGYDDILIGAYNNNDMGEEAGRTYLIFGRGSGWSMDMELSEANASFTGEYAKDWSGYSVTGAGDVNGDHYDDILIGAYKSDGGPSNSGQVYLILGKASGWGNDVNLSNSDASFWGEMASDKIGYSIAGGGDVNKDGYDDFLVATPFNHDLGKRSGKTYLILGKTSGWSMDTNLSNADAVFWGEDEGDMAGFESALSGDVNGDGYDDILIGAYGNDDGGTTAGKAYLFLGKASAWTGDVDVVDADICFQGETSSDEAGAAIAMVEDVNGDGHDDLLIGAYGSDEKVTNAGQTYLVFADTNLGPSSVSSVRAYSDPAYTNEIFVAEMNDTVYVELRGTDGNSSRADLAVMNLTTDMSQPVGFHLRLQETGPNTGIYRGAFKITNRTHHDYGWIEASAGELVHVSSVEDRTKNVTISVSLPPVQLRPIYYGTTVQEDEEFNIHYWSLGSNPVSEWTFETNASWLEWDATEHVLHGIPGNDDVGTNWVRVNITDGSGHYDEHSYTLNVKNTRPKITTSDLEGEIPEDGPYRRDYNCSDDGEGTITWHLDTDAAWLYLNTSSGLLNGTPTNDDLGKYHVNISVDDGNGGWDRTEYNLTVLNTNDPPLILTPDRNVTWEDEHYNVTYEATDVDEGDSTSWAFSTNATSWLEFNEYTGLLEGQPTNGDVGEYWVNITAVDQNNGTDVHNFTLIVLNTNDGPSITSLPPEQVSLFSEYNYQVRADDADMVHGEILTYTLDTSPLNMTINASTGLISWSPTGDQEGINPVTVRVSDGNTSITQAFNVTVTVPEIELLVPKNGTTLETVHPELFWTFSYNGTGEIEYDLYLDTDEHPTTLFLSGINGTSCDIQTSLENGTLYYWRVVPVSGEIVGRSSPVWSFRTQKGDIPDPEYGVNLDLDRYSVDSRRGKWVQVMLTVHNEGDRSGQVNITIESDLHTSLIDCAKSVQVDQAASVEVPLRIYVPKGLEPGGLTINITATLMNSTSEKVLTINVVQPRSPVSTVSFWKEPVFWLLLVLVAAISMSGVGYAIYSRKKREQELIEAREEIEQELEAVKSRADAVEDFDIEEIFVIYQDGRLISHVSGKESELDEHIFGGMLIAIQDFVKDSFRSEEGLTSFEYGKNKMVLEKGNHIFLAVALSGTEPDMLRDQLRMLVQKIEGLYAGRIEEWDGDTGAFEGINHYLVPLFRIKEGLKIRKEKEEVKVKSGIEFFGGYVRLKVAISNGLSSTIGDIVLTLYYDWRTLRLSHIDPDYPMRENMVYLDDIASREKRTVAFYFDPLICQESHVDARVTYRDEYGTHGEAEMKRRPVDIVCPIFYTTENINVAMLKRLMEDVEFSDNRIYFLQQDQTPTEAYDLAKEAIAKHDIRLIREFTDASPFVAEAWYYGKTSETEEEMILKMCVREDVETLEVFVACSNLASMTGLLAEVGNNIMDLFRERGYTIPEASLDPSIKEQILNLERLLDRYGSGPD